VQRGEASDSFFLMLATVLVHYEAPALQARFAGAFGRDWRQRFDKTWARNAWWHPLPVPWCHRSGAQGAEPGAAADRAGGCR